MKKILYTLVIGLIVVFGGNSCREPDYITTTSYDQLIGEYLEQDSTFSEFAQILNLTGNMSFLKAYGAYTLFAPTNDAINNFLAERNVSNIGDIPTDQLNDIVKYHVILDTLATTEFSDGKLRTPTMYGQYLLVKTKFVDGHAKPFINKYAEVLHADMRFSNGIIHSIDHVLEPVKESAAQIIENDDKYSIFTQALKATGYYDTINVVSPQDQENKRMFTVFAQTDESLKKAGINSYNDLKAMYSNTGDPAQKGDSLNLYVAYHIINNALLYMGDLVLYQAKETMAPSEVVTIKLNQDSLMLNEDLFNGVIEKGINVIRDESDQTAANGVVHTLNDNLHIKVRVPFAVYFDVADQPELRKMVGVWRTPGGSVTLSNGQLAGVRWYGDNTIQYRTDNGGSLSPKSLIYSDYFDIILRTAVIRWVEFDTPLLVKGKYKVWICSRNVTSRRAQFTVSFDGNAMPNIIDNMINLPNDPLPSDEELLGLGLKRYNYNPIDSASYYSDSHGRVVGQLAGTIDVPTTGTHTIRFDVINNEMGGTWIDMIEFIPTDQNQIWPRVNGDGELVYGYPDGYSVNQ